ncbi:NAD(P)-dependent oxidoreductase [Desulfococcaceae bacterium HSG7]|nr:NAD(P)-dependent oxidoreductase [Desulfococcaceae bacterium HSG7]
MSILITGAEGFVGRNLAEYLSNKKYSVLLPTQDELDLTNSEHVDKYFSINNDIETIIHCATVLRQGTSYPVNTCEKNLRMFFNLQKQMTPSRKMINLGSGSEYNRKYWSRKMPEKYFNTHIPVDSHSYAKYLISKYIIDMKFDNIICLRIFGIFGKYEDYRYKFISNAIVKNLLKMPIIINKNVIYDYIFIADFLQIIEFFVNNKTRNIVFNTTPVVSIDLLTIANLINSVSVHKSEIHVLNKGIGVEYSGDNRNLLAEIGNFQFTAYDTAIADLYKYYKERINSLDANAVKQDAYLDYAKTLNKNYFRKHHEK